MAPGWEDKGMYWAWRGGEKYTKSPTEKFTISETNRFGIRQTKYVLDVCQDGTVIGVTEFGMD